MTEESKSSLALAVRLFLDEGPRALWNRALDRRKEKIRLRRLPQASRRSRSTFRRNWIAARAQRFFTSTLAQARRRPDSDVGSPGRGEETANRRVGLSTRWFLVVGSFGTIGSRYRRDRQRRDRRRPDPTSSEPHRHLGHPHRIPCRSTARSDRRARRSKTHNCALDP